MGTINLGNNEVWSRNPKKHNWCRKNLNIFPFLEQKHNRKALFSQKSQYTPTVILRKEGLHETGTGVGWGGVVRHYFMNSVLTNSLSFRWRIPLFLSDPGIPGVRVSKTNQLYLCASYTSYTSYISHRLYTSYRLYTEKVTRVAPSGG